MNLNAELVVLSACQTGKGALQRGEGSMGLSRAFQYAGCPNIVNTLWSVEDKAAAEIMQQFYSYLEKGVGKGDALRQAKRDYFKANNVHPAKWGAFILTGDNAPVEISTPWWKKTWVWVMTGSLLLLLGGGAILWRKRFQASSA